MTEISPRLIRPEEFDGSIPVTVADISHQVQRAVAPTKIAAQEYAGAFGLLGSTAQELICAAPSLVAERIPTSSVPVGILAKAVPTEVKPRGGQDGAGEGCTGFLFLATNFFFTVETFECGFAVGVAA